MTDPDKHRRKMKRVKRIKDRMYEQRSREKGLLIVHTGTGKGKTTAALGMVLRCLGHDMRVGVVQYVKGTRDTAEHVVLVEHFGDRVDFYRMGKGFTWETQDIETDRRAAREAWSQSRQMITSGEHDFVLLDELNIVLRDGLLELDEVVGVLERRPTDLHVVATGRHAPDELVEAADLVTEMRLVKHPFQDQDVGAQPGIEY